MDGVRGNAISFRFVEVPGSAELENVLNILTQGWTVPAAVKPDKRLRDMPVENQVVTFDFPLNEK